MTPDIEKAQKLCDEINADPRKWAEVEIYNFTDTRRLVRVHEGTVHTNGLMERTIKTTTFRLLENGNVDVQSIAHY